MHGTSRAATPPSAPGSHDGERLSIRRRADHLRRSLVPSLLGARRTNESLANADTQPRDKNSPKLMDAIQAALSRIAAGGGDPKQELESVQQQLSNDFK